MRTSRSFRPPALGLLAALAVMAGCSGGETAGTSSLGLAPALTPLHQHHTVLRNALMAGGGVVAVNPDRSPSWMDRAAAKSAALLYVSDFVAGRVNVYTYPQAKKAGSLSGFDQPQGLCTDAAGNVWVANTGTSEIIEFAHGGTAPIATLENPGQNPTACTVDPRSGDLAVSSVTTTEGGRGSVSIFTKAKGTPKTLSDPGLAAMYFAGYDHAGNLFVDGLQARTHLFAYAELRRGHHKFAALALQGAMIRFPGGVQYDGTGMAVGDQDGAQIYQTSGSTITGSTALTGACDVAQFFVDGTTVVAPNLCPGVAGNVLFYKYPAGGKATKNLRNLDYPVGAAISRTQ
jgi:hypothetical protein